MPHPISQSIKQVTMNRNKSFGRRELLLLLLTLFTFSCTKTSTPPGTSSLIIANATVGTSILVTNFNGGGQPLYYYNNAYRLYYGAYQTSDEMSYYSGEQHLALYQYPDTTEHSQPLFDLTLNLPIGSMHTLFLTGTTAKPDTLLINENPPVYPFGDSVTSLRFINLSPGSGPIRINIQGQPTGSEVNGLDYKSYTSFKPYPATAAIKNYVFEFRDAVKDSVLATFTGTRVSSPGISYLPNSWIYRSSTIAFIGQPGDGSQSAYRIYNF
jgi:hypothetical protein